MEEAPENGKESSHSARANGMNEWVSDNYKPLPKLSTYSHSVYKKPTAKHMKDAFTSSL